MGKFFNSEMYSAKRFVSSIWKVFRSNPRIHSCFTCLSRVSSFLCTFKLLGYQPPNDVASRLFSFALDCHLELTFQYDRICQLKALPHRVQNVFWQEWDSNPRTHSRTRVLDGGFSWAWRLRSLAHSALFPSTHFFFYLWPFHWVNFSIPKCILLNGLCHPFEKFFVQTHAYIRVSHVSAGYPLFCALLNCSAINHPMTLRVVCFLLLWTVILNWYCSMTEFVSWRLCFIVFKTFSDRSGIRTHAHTLVPEISTEQFLESGALDHSAILPGFRRHIFSFCSACFQLIDIFNSEM